MFGGLVSFKIVQIKKNIYIFFRLRSNIEILASKLSNRQNNILLHVFCLNSKDFISNFRFLCTVFVYLPTYGAQGQVINNNNNNMVPFSIVIFHRFCPYFCPSILFHRFPSMGQPKFQKDIKKWTK